MHTAQSQLVRDSLLAVHSPDTYPVRTFSVPVVKEIVAEAVDGQLALDLERPA